MTRKLLPLLAFLPWCLPAQAAGPLALGVDQPSLYKPVLAGKRIALVVNQASVSKGTHTIDKLQAEGLRLVKLFALEHGIRGEGGAGETIDDSVDEKTGLPILSLYGRNKKPTPAMLEGVDAIVYDVQDVGVRFFTYISSLGLIMEAAAESSVAVVVLDRPNPNGDYTEGPLLQQENASFVGAFPIPLVYGLTVGELARMILGEGWKRARGLQLHVIPMKGYDPRKPAPLETIPSPGLREPNAVRLYPSMALFEATAISFGRGTDRPFLQYGLPGSPPLGPHSFTPRRKEGAKEGPVHEGKVCHGEEFYSRPLSDIPRFTTDLFTRVMAKAKGRGELVKDRRFLELLVGDKRVVREILAGRPYAKIRPLFAKELASFVAKKKKYLLY